MFGVGVRVGVRVAWLSACASVSQWVGVVAAPVSGMAPVV